MEDNQPAGDVDARLKQELGAGRRSRAMDDRQVTENRAISDDERLEAFRLAQFNDALPDIPKIPGYHSIWLTTTNPRDSIHRRMQLGYEPVKPEDVPNLTYATQNSGEYSGMISINEMVAFKLPEQLYQLYMKEAHHDAPLREEGKLSDTADQIRQQAERSGGALIEEEGMQDIRQGANRRAPTFAG